MRRWFKAMADMLRNWCYAGPSERTVEFPVSNPVERPPARRAIAVPYYAPMRRQKGPSLGQRRASKRRDFNQALRRV
jgi:hypothetical protein